MVTRLRFEANQVARDTGSGPLSFTTSIGDRFRLMGVFFHLNAVPKTSEEFTVTIDDVEGPEYDTLLASVDISAFTNARDVVYIPDDDLILEKGSQIKGEYPNSEGAIFGYSMRFITL